MSPVLRGFPLYPASETISSALCSLTSEATNALRSCVKARLRLSSLAWVFGVRSESNGFPFGRVTVSKVLINMICGPEHHTTRLCSFVSTLKYEKIRQSRGRAGCEFQNLQETYLVVSLSYSLSACLSLSLSLCSTYIYICIHRCRFIGFSSSLSDFYALLVSFMFFLFFYDSLSRSPSLCSR